MTRKLFLLDRSDLLTLDLNLDEYTVDIITRVALAQSRKIEKELFPSTFPETAASYCDSYFKVKAEDVWKLRKELGY